MATVPKAAILLVGALCLVSLPDIALSSSSPQFFVEGKVYCEVCRLNFINKFSEAMPGARVRIECHGEGVGNVTYSAEAETNALGVYRLPVEGDHEEEQCQVTLSKSSRSDCDQIPDEGWAIEPSSRVSLASNSGIHDQIRSANPLYYTTSKTLPQCDEIIKELQADNDLN